ncbi:IclR family transcriptional regulator [Pseudaminobacter soli (ex Li et al. 2025)]|uniref:IclR family transcriptional regulator n=1 Tax=Pseudaminobacter soli (ex Li et al. 2025) TaxID=1295366 RepID=A0A2P7SEL4_9HYPH|nr:IclR family transcriptional regulator [Mesorhizobium soli]PSJ60917.1 IclR family transcriptional regulator [Mesorhizobium soli]
MSTIGKALTLLDAVSRLEKDVGLTEIARHCGLDKATARRFLVELEKHGFVEQDPETRRYRIGGAPVRLARIREARFPYLSTAAPFVRELAEASGETVHLSEYAAGRLSTILVEDSPRANRVIVDVGSVLPFHATASGLAFLAFCSARQLEDVLSAPLEAFTENTVTSANDLRSLLAETARRGYSVCLQGLESGVISTAAPIKAPNSLPIGTIAVAAPLVRADEATIHRLGSTTAATAKRISEKFFGLEQLAAQPLARRAG